MIDAVQPELTVVAARAYAVTAADTNHRSLQTDEWQPTLFFHKLLNNHIDIVILCRDIKYLWVFLFFSCVVFCCTEAAESQIHSTHTHGRKTLT